MISSMTGFGQGAAQLDGSTIRVEIKTVNNRFRDVIVKGPRALAPLEDRIKNLIGQDVARGRIEVFIRIEGEPPWQSISVNAELARQYRDALTRLAEELNLADRPDLRQIAAYRDVIGQTEDPADLETVWPVVESAAAAALKGLVEMRRTEGLRLAEDIAARLDILAEMTARLEAEAPGLVAASRERLRERLANLVEQDIDPARLAQEAAILADKSDVTEELTRLKSHLDQFRAIMGQGGAIGRKLDFLAQELLRELNTIGSKSSEVEITQLIVEAKAEQEKIREQIQNLE